MQCDRKQACLLRGWGWGHRVKREREKGKERVSQSVRSDDLDGIRLWGKGRGGGCMEVDGNSDSGGRWSQLIGRVRKIVLFCHGCDVHVSCLTVFLTEEK